MQSLLTYTFTKSIIKILTYIFKILIYFSIYLPYIILFFSLFMSYFYNNPIIILFISTYIINICINFFIKYIIFLFFPFNPIFLRPINNNYHLFNTHLDNIGMPSGHSQIISFTSTFWILIILYNIYHNYINDNIHLWILLIIILILLVIFINYSRYYLKYHTILQIIIGNILGICFASLIFYLYKGGLPGL
jgi:dolichyldiphosphatase